MPLEYLVVAGADLMTAPSVWQFPAARARQYAIALQDALNRMASEGWQLVESHKEPWSGAIYFIFQREIPQRHQAGAQQGIQAVYSGARA